MHTSKLDLSKQTERRAPSLYDDYNSRQCPVRSPFMVTRRKGSSCRAPGRCTWPNTCRTWPDTFRRPGRRGPAHAYAPPVIQSRQFASLTCGDWTKTCRSPHLSCILLAWKSQETVSCRRRPTCWTMTATVWTVRLNPRYESPSVITHYL